MDGRGLGVVASSTIFAVLHEGFGHDAFGLRTADVFVISLILAGRGCVPGVWRRPSPYMPSQTLFRY